METHTVFLTDAMAALWNFRHAMHVQNGQAYKVGAFTIHLGALNGQRWGSQFTPASNVYPGVVVCITLSTAADDSDPWSGGGDFFDGTINQMDGTTDMRDDEEDFLEGAGSTVSAFWDSVRQGMMPMPHLDVTEVRMRGAKAAMKKGFDAEAAVVAMWCEVLRLRG